MSKLYKITDDYFEENIIICNSRGVIDVANEYIKAEDSDSLIKFEDVKSAIEFLKSLDINIEEIKGNYIEIKRG